MAATIHPLCFGWLDIEQSLLTYGRGFGQRITLPLLGFLVRDASSLVLVDTGPPAPEWCEAHLRPIRQDRSETLTGALADAGATPADIDLVVLTHLHWDHCGGTEALPGADVVAQRSELDYARCPLPLHVMSYQAPASGLPPLVKPGRIRELAGDHRLAPSIELLHVPGHSPGSQAALVTGAARSYVIAGDTIPLFDNLAPLSKHCGFTPNGIHVDLRELVHSMQRLVGLGVDILPGHDARVLETPEYR